jgi:hypothetical protein
VTATLEELDATLEPTMSLSKLIRTVADELQLTDPREIAEAVANATPEEELRTYYANALVPKIRTLLGEDRNLAMRNFQQNDFEPEPEPEAEPQPRAKGRRPVAKSKKLSQRRDWWAEWLDTKIHTGESIWKRLGDCSAADLKAASAERFEQAALMQEKGKTYEELAKMMTKKRVKTVAALNSAEVHKLVGGAK